MTDPPPPAARLASALAAGAAWILLGSFVASVAAAQSPRTAGAFFVWKEASHTGEIYLFAAAFLPGIIAGWACLVAFGGPMWRALRAG